MVYLLGCLGVVDVRFVLVLPVLELLEGLSYLSELFFGLVVLTGFEYSTPDRGFLGAVYCFLFSFPFRSLKAFLIIVFLITLFVVLGRCLSGLLFTEPDKFLRVLRLILFVFSERRLADLLFTEPDTFPEAFRLTLFVFSERRLADLLFTELDTFDPTLFLGP